MKIKDPQGPDTLAYVYHCMDAEGLDYCFRNLSNFEEVQDAEFHKLRLAYIQAADALEEYVNDQNSDQED